MEMIGDQAKALATLRAVSPQTRASSKIQRVLTERMSLSEAIEAAGAIVDCYPNGGTSASRGYIGALAATLASYPRQVALRCADHHMGIVRECKFLPTVADIVAWCERETAPLWNSADREKRIERQIAERNPPEISPEQREKIGSGLRELADSLRAKACPSPEKIAERARKDEEIRRRRLAEIRAQWDGNAPTIGGIPVSRELADKLTRAANAAVE